MNPGAMTDEVTSMLGNVTVMTTQGRGFTPEEIAERILPRFINISHNAHPLLAEQAEAFKADILRLLTYACHEAVRSHKVTLNNKFTAAGHPELIPILNS